MSKMTTSTSISALTRRSALALALAAGLTFPAAAQTPVKSLTVALTADAVILDPHAANELSANIMFYHFYDGLVTRSPELGFQPGLAEKYDVSAVSRTFWK